MKMDKINFKKQLINENNRLKNKIFEQYMNQKHKKQEENEFLDNLEIKLILAMFCIMIVIVYIAIQV